VRRIEKKNNFGIGNHPLRRFGIGLLIIAALASPRFENPDHDFPQRIEYRSEGDRLHAEVTNRVKNGKEAVLGFDYRPCGS
jgi:hypothetical protein